jgi:DnaJ family protein B protein 6
MRMILLRCCLLLLLAIALVIAADKTYYELLEVPIDASATDIKKAYRRLALLHHPDRNRGNEKEAQVIFRDISEAYEVLSEDNSRASYNRSLNRPHGSAHANFHERQRRQRTHRDPFTQFNDLFQNDPFFRDAFKGMDDLFDEMFQDQKKGAPPSNDGSGGGASWWNKLGINFHMTTTTTTNAGGGQQKRSSSTRRSVGGSSGSTYQSRSTRTVIENGQRVTIQSLEKDGNKIEEKYLGERLISRHINGQPDQQIGAGEEL